MQICAVLLCENCENVIEDAVLRCRNELEPDVFVMDLGSTDRTLERGRSAGAGVLSAPEDGVSPVLTALKEVSALGFSHAVVWRVGVAGSMVPDCLPQLVNGAWDRPDAILVGVARQAAKRGGRPRGHFWTGLSGWQSAAGMGSVLRLYPVEEVRSLRCVESGIHFDAEVLIKASWAGLPILPLGLHAHQVESLEPGANWKFNFRMFSGMLLRFPKLVLQKLG